MRPDTRGFSMRNILIATSLLVLAACNVKTGDDDAITSASTSADQTANATATDNLADTMASRDPMDDQAIVDEVRDSEERPMMHLQVVLDRQGFGPGVIDGKMGMSTENALRGFQKARSIEVTGKHDDRTKKALAGFREISATRVVTIPVEWGAETYEKIPGDAGKQAEMKRLGYETLDEKIAERFHTTIAVLVQLNPNGKPAGSPSPTATPDNAAKKAKSGSSVEAKAKNVFVAGQMIRVPNIGADRISPGSIADKGWQQTLAALGVGSDQPKVSRIVVSDKAGTLEGFDEDDKLVALFTVTTGSKNDPLPLGEWGITGVGHNPTFSYNPELFWDVPDSKAKQQLPPGPNGPVGVVWIDLTKQHYGIHGTPSPETIGRTQSHGCVRLTNWDAARLAQMVTTDTKVLFKS